MISSDQKIAQLSKRLQHAGIYLVLLVPIAYLAETVVLPVINALFFDSDTVSHFTVLKNQHSLLKRMNVPVDVGDFHLFEIFIWTSLIVAILRLLTGLGSRAAMETTRSGLRKANDQGISTSKVLVLCLLVAPMGILLSLFFSVSSLADSNKFLIAYSPRTFICLQATLFCGSVFFLSEGILFLVAVIFAPRQQE